ncbi:hypothetical protein [Streptomyces sp. 061-3]|uniref:hypothetical protein n=1 Tax=Streptomyces sp. 061-3 TaxID=2789268 RepID=UPI0039815467
MLVPIGAVHPKPALVTTVIPPVAEACRCRRLQTCGCLGPPLALAYTDERMSDQDNVLYGQGTRPGAGAGAAPWHACDRLGQAEGGAVETAIRSGFSPS